MILFIIKLRPKGTRLGLEAREIYRFYFDNRHQILDYLFDQPESEAPHKKINMLVTPRVDNRGAGYRNARGNSSKPVTFHHILSHNVGTIKDYQVLEARGETLGQQDEQFLVAHPFAKILLSDTNITGVRTVLLRQMILVILLHLWTAHDRTNSPEVTIYRTSLWEDYNDDNASVKVQTGLVPCHP